MFLACVRFFCKGGFGALNLFSLQNAQIPQHDAKCKKYTSKCVLAFSFVMFRALALRDS